MAVCIIGHLFDIAGFVQIVSGFHCYFIRTQVGRKKILRPTGEGLLRNSAN